MADSRGFKPINQLWSVASAAGSTDADSECLYEEISSLSGPQDSEERLPIPKSDRVRRSKKKEDSRGRKKNGVTDNLSRVEDQYAVRGSYGESGPHAAFDVGATTLKLTRGRKTASRYLQTTTTTTTTTYHQGGRIPRFSTRPSRHHFARSPFSNETQEEIQEDDEATLRELLVRYVLQIVYRDYKSYTLFYYTHFSLPHLQSMLILLQSIQFYTQIICS